MTEPAPNETDPAATGTGGARAPKRPRAAAGLLAIWGAACVLALVAGLRISASVEHSVARRAEAALAPSGQGWARVEADGLRTTLTGEAPNAAAVRAALTALQRAAPNAAAGFAPVIADETTLAPAPPAFHPEPRVSILRGVNDLTVIGAAPGPAARTALGEALAKAAPHLSVIDLTRDDASGPGDYGGGGAAEGWAARIAAALMQGRVTLTPGKIDFSGVAAGDAEENRIEAAMAEAEAAGWTVEADLASPPVAPAAFSLVAETGRGARGLVACAAGDEAEAARIDAQAARVGLKGAPCVPARGAPANWGAAVEAGLTALGALPAGELRMTGPRVRLSARPPTRRRLFEAEAGRLRRALPEEYQLAALSVGEEEPAAPPEATEGAPPPLVLAYDGATMRLSGGAPDPLIGESLAAFARATTTGAEVTDDFTYDGDFDPGWQAAAMGLIGALAQLEGGGATLDGRGARLSGDVADPLAIAAIHRGLIAELGARRVAETRLKISPAALAAAELLPPARCAAELTTRMAAAPIRFPPGEAEIGAENDALFADLAETLRRCADGRIEIGGHTDSQGSETGNLRLSRARAEAVLTRLLEAGAPLARLSAKGFGESEPIADNATEAGRAKNRRIEFRALDEGPPESAAADGGAADGGGEAPEAEEKE